MPTRNRQLVHGWRGFCPHFSHGFGKVGYSLNSFGIRPLLVCTLAQRDATLVARRKKAIEDAAARVRWLDLYAFILRHIEHASCSRQKKSGS